MFKKSPPGWTSNFPRLLERAARTCADEEPHEILRRLAVELGTRRDVPGVGQFRIVIRVLVVARGVSVDLIGLPGVQTLDVAVVQVAADDVRIGSVSAGRKDIVFNAVQLASFSVAPASKTHPIFPPSNFNPNCMVRNLFKIQDDPPNDTNHNF